MDSIIFDVDGTLWDSTDICARAWNTVLSRETPDAPPVTGQRLKELFGRRFPISPPFSFPGNAASVSWN